MHVRGSDKLGTIYVCVCVGGINNKWL